MRRYRLIVAVALVLAVAAPAAAGLLDALTGALAWTVELAVILAEKKPRLKEIYLSHFGAAGPAGTVHPNLTVAEDGTVLAAEIERDDFGNAAFAEAIRQELLTWTMPQATWGMEVGFDLEFDPSRDLYGADVQVEK
jgi:hypothetical protein